MFDLADPASSHLEARIDLRNTHYAVGDYALALDHAQLPFFLVS